MLRCIRHVIPVESLSVSHAYDEGDFGSTLASVLCCLATRQSIWATLVTKSRLFRLLSLQPNYPQAFPPDVTSYPHSLAPTSTSPSPCSWHHPRHQSPLSQGPHTTYKTTFCTSCSSLHGLFELWDNLLLNVDGAVDISRILFARLFA